MNKLPYRQTVRATVVYPGFANSDEQFACIVGKHLKIDSDGMQSYSLGQWSPEIHDAILLAAAVELCDGDRPRAKMDWGRDIVMDFPVHDLIKWERPSIRNSLRRALNLLTGDSWDVRFHQTPERQSSPEQSRLSFPQDVDAVIPFSDGLDSRAVAEIITKTSNQKLLKVRVGSSRIGGPSIGAPRQRLSVR